MEHFSEASSSAPSTSAGGRNVPKGTSFESPKKTGGFVEFSRQEMEHFSEASSSAPSTSAGGRNVPKGTSFESPKKTGGFTEFSRQNHSTPKMSPFMKSLSRRGASSIETSECGVSVKEVRNFSKYTLQWLCPCSQNL
jgi:hypothetical protein